jgi:lysophospholipase L1-like esterase
VRTVLFFGDSNVRGFGNDPRERYAALTEAAVASDTRAAWRFVVASAASDFHTIPPYLERAVAKNAPSIIVWQCPTGPACYFINHPPWARRLGAMKKYVFGRIRTRHIRADVRSDASGQRSERDALHEGRYIDGLHRWRAERWIGLRQWNRWIAARHGTIVKATRERYAQRICEIRDQLRTQCDAPILFLNLLPASDDCYPGYAARVAEWTPFLRAALHRPELASFFLDIHAPLRRWRTRDLLLRDGTHLSPTGHRRIAELIAPVLRELMREQEERAISARAASGVPARLPPAGGGA